MRQLYSVVPNLLVHDGLFQQPQDTNTGALLGERKCNTPRSLTGGQPCRKASRRAGPACSSVSGRGPHAMFRKLRVLHPQKHLPVATRLVQSLRLTLPKPLEQVPHQGLESSPCTLQLATGTSPPPKALFPNSFNFQLLRGCPPPQDPIHGYYL